MISAEKRVLVRGKLRRNARACARDIKLGERLFYPEQNQEADRRGKFSIYGRKIIDEKIASGTNRGIACFLTFINVRSSDITYRYRAIIYFICNAHRNRLFTNACWTGNLIHLRSSLEMYSRAVYCASCRATMLHTRRVLSSLTFRNISVVREPRDGFKAQSCAQGGEQSTSYRACALVAWWAEHGVPEDSGRIPTRPLVS